MDKYKDLLDDSFDLQVAYFNLVEEFLDCANYDTLMEGPKFKSWNVSRLNALREKLEKK